MPRGVDDGNPPYETNVLPCRNLREFTIAPFPEQCPQFIMGGVSFRDQPRRNIRGKHKHALQSHAARRVRFRAWVERNDRGMTMKTTPQRRQISAGQNISL